jgi:hypothetical protein
MSVNHRYPTMKQHLIHVYSKDVYVNLAGVKNDPTFKQAVVNALYPKLYGIYYTVKTENAGVVLESNSLPTSFVGTTIPFQYLSRKFELYFC